MCGRYTLHHSIKEITERFGVSVPGDESAVAGGVWERYNVAPGQMVPAIIQQDGERKLVEFQWGLIPFWSKDPSLGSRLINARSETLAEKPAFKYALTQRRCLIPADGFYEWKQEGGSRTRQPMHICREDRALFAFAGLWEEWQPPGRDVPPVRTCTIVTTTPNELLATLHHRMAVILRPEDEEGWLNPTVRDPAQIMAMLQPYADGQLEAYPVSTKINSPAHDAPDCIELVEIDNTVQQASLF